MTTPAENGDAIGDAGGGDYGLGGDAADDGDIELGDIELEETTAFIGGGQKSNAAEAIPYTFDAREAVRRLWPIIVALVAYIALFATKAVLLFPFLRTLVACDSVANATAINRDSHEWSGSPHCGDRVFVAERATWYRGLCEGLEHFAQCLSLPILGALVDTLGRRRVMLIGVLGLGVQFLCWAAAARRARSATSTASGT